MNGTKTPSFHARIYNSGAVSLHKTGNKGALSLIYWRGINPLASCGLFCPKAARPFATRQIMLA
jgi:hypothetical protein